MTRLISTPRVVGNYGPALEALFDDVFAPIFETVRPSAGAFEPSIIRRLRSWPREVAFHIPPVGLAIAGITVGEMPLRLLRGQLAAMLGLDLLTIDLSRPGGMIDCEVELCAGSRDVKHSIAGLVMWVGASGAIAFVSEDSSPGIDFWKPSVLLSATGLTVTDTHSFIDEADRTRGILRAVEAVNCARWKVALAATNGAGRTI